MPEFLYYLIFRGGIFFVGLICEGDFVGLMAGDVGVVILVIGGRVLIGEMIVFWLFIHVSCLVFVLVEVGGLLSMPGCFFQLGFRFGQHRMV